MQFNLSKLTQENVILSNEDEQFVGTDLELQPFMIEVKRITRADKINIASDSANDEGIISSGEYSKAMFINSIVSVDGFTDENQTPITINENVRELIWEYAPDALVDAIKGKIQSYDVKEEKKSDEPEAPSLDTPIG